MGWEWDHLCTIFPPAQQSTQTSECLLSFFVTVPSYTRLLYMCLPGLPDGLARCMILGDVTVASCWCIHIATLVPASPTTLWHSFCRWPSLRFKHDNVTDVQLSINCLV